MFIIIFYIFKWCQILCKSTYNSHVKIEGYRLEIDYAGELISIISYLISVNVSFISSSSLISLLFIMSAFFWHKSSPRLSKACCLQYSILKYKNKKVFLFYGYLASCKSTTVWILVSSNSWTCPIKLATLFVLGSFNKVSLI